MCTEPLLYGIENDLTSNLKMAAFSSQNNTTIIKPVTSLK